MQFKCHYLHLWFIDIIVLYTFSPTWPLAVKNTWLGHSWKPHYEVSSFHGRKASQKLWVFRKYYDFLQYSNQRYIGIASIISNYSPELCGPRRIQPPIFAVRGSPHTKEHAIIFYASWNSSIKSISGMDIQQYTKPFFRPFTVDPNLHYTSALSLFLPTQPRNSVS